MAKCWNSRDAQCRAVCPGHAGSRNLAWRRDAGGSTHRLHDWRQCWRRLRARTATWWARAQTLPFLSKSLPNQAAPAYPMPFIAKCMARSTPLSSRWEKSGSGLSSNRSRCGDFSQPRRRSNRRPRFDRRAAKFSTQTADLDMGGPYERFFRAFRFGSNRDRFGPFGPCPALPLGRDLNGGDPRIGSFGPRSRRKERAAATQTMWEATAATSRECAKSHIQAAYLVARNAYRGDALQKLLG